MLPRWNKLFRKIERKMSMYCNLGNYAPGEQGCRLDVGVVLLVLANKHSLTASFPGKHIVTYGVDLELVYSAAPCVNIGWQISANPT